MNKEESIRVSSVARQLKAERDEARREAERWRNNWKDAITGGHYTLQLTAVLPWEKPSHEDSMETGEGNRPDLTENERPKWTVDPINGEYGDHVNPCDGDYSP